MTDWQDKFRRVAARKEEETATAALPPYLTEFATEPSGAIAVGNRWTRTLFDGDFYMSPSHGGRLPACNLVFVQSKDGNTAIRNPAALGGGETDKHLIYEGLSRVAADGVLAGAETVRGGAMIFRCGIQNWCDCASRSGSRGTPRRSSPRFRASSLDVAFSSTSQKSGSSS